MSSAAFLVHPTPIGQALIVVTDSGLTRLEILDRPADVALGELSLRTGVLPVPGAAQTANVAAQLDEYFAGARRDFDVALDLGSATSFTRAAWEAMRSIPFGQTASYGEVAAAAGSPGAHRAVGTACARIPISVVIPAHRVVRADGSPGEYGGHPERKLFLLQMEAGVAAGETSGV